MREHRRALICNKLLTKKLQPGYAGWLMNCQQDTIFCFRALTSLACRYHWRGILAGKFGFPGYEAVHPLGLLLAALPPTIIAALAFRLL